jgi:broad specificity phosphatase PhoE
MVTIIFEPHGTTVDNEAGLASGHHDVELSALGERQAAELGYRYRNAELAAVFCSDLRRSYATGEIAFARRNLTVIRDNRLRECDYGKFTGKERAVVDREQPMRISEPFPGGESYEQSVARMKSFLLSLLSDYDGKTVMIIGHRATQYGLEHWINKLPLKIVITAQWRWRPGWTYHLDRLRQ